MNFKIESGKGVELVLVPENFEGLNVCDETLGYLKESFSPKLGNILTILGPGKNNRVPDDSLCILLIAVLLHLN